MLDEGVGGGKRMLEGGVGCVDAVWVFAVECIEMVDLSSSDRIKCS